MSEAPSRQPTFQIIGGAATAIYRFVTWFFGLTTMLTKLQRNNDLKLAGITNTFPFKVERLIVTNGTEDEHITKVKEVLRRLDQTNVSLQLETYAFAADSFE